VPHTAITASPMNFSTTPPYRPITVRATAKYADNNSRTASGSRDSDSGVKPHHVTKQHRAHPPLRHRPRGPRRRRRRYLRRRAAPSQRVPARMAKPAVGNNRLATRRTTAHGQTTVPAEPVALPQGCAAPRAPLHQALIPPQSPPGYWPAPATAPARSGDAGTDADNSRTCGIPATQNQRICAREAD